MFKCKNKFWTENIIDLFCDFKLIPLKNMTLEQKMNSITRLILFITILILLFDGKKSLIFLTLSLLIIIIYYNITKNKMEKHKENFTYTYYLYYNR
jgi:hypothetical protein